jgi:hypothetical protein
MEARCVADLLSLEQDAAEARVRAMRAASGNGSLISVGAAQSAVGNVHGIRAELRQIRNAIQQVGWQLSRL